MAKKKSSKLKLWWRRTKRRRTKAKAARPQRKIRTMDVILVIIGIALVAFTLEMIKIYKETGMIPDTLCTCVFSALGGECGAMAFIKSAKERRQDRKWIREDQDREERLLNEAGKEDSNEP